MRINFVKAFPFILLCPLFSFALDAPARAGEQILGKFHNWTIARQGPGLCYGYVDYTTGGRLVVQAKNNSNGEVWSLLLGEHGGLSDFSGGIEAAVDGEVVFRGVGRTIGTTSGIKLTPLAPSAVARLERGQSLTVASAARQTRYDLTGAPTVVDQLYRCLHGEDITVPTTAESATANTPDVNAPLFNVKPFVEGGFAIMRTGPGVNWPIVAKIPAGTQGLKRLAPCRDRDDGLEPRPWCPLAWDNIVGFVSTLNLETSFSESPPQPVTGTPPPTTGDVKATGSGFLVDGVGHILTNAHVAGECGSVTAALSGKPQSSARLVAIDPTNDLALLDAPDIKAATVPELVGGVRTGANIAVFGFPLSQQLSTNGNFTTGLISATTGLYDDSSRVQMTAPVQPGNSGGPVLDENGNVVAIVVAKLNALKTAADNGDVPQNVNFAIKASVAATFLEAHGVTLSASAAAGKDRLSNPDLADRAKGFTVFINCRN